MPAIGAAAQRLIRDAKLTSADVGELRQAVRAGQATLKDVETIATRMVDTLDAGVGTELKKLLGELGGNLNVSAPIGNLSGAPGLLNGTISLPRDAATRKAETEAVQKALIALASRTNDPSLMLPGFGADRSWGAETQAALQAFQSKNGLPTTGVVDMATARKLDAALKLTNIPVIFATTPASGPTAADVVKAAKELVNSPLLGKSFGESQTWRCVDPNHPLYRGPGAEVPNTASKWKCNLFANSVLAVAGFQPAMYGDGRHGEYAIAVELHRYSTKFQGNTKGIFNQLDTFKPGDVADPSARAADLLKTVQPGDLVIVRHHGGTGSDGGHCRVVVANNGDGTFEFAQASAHAAVIKTEGPSSFTGEEEVWVLRPTKKRPEGPISV